MTMENDVMKMRKLEDGIAVPAGEAVELKNGSLHLMFMEVKKPSESKQPWDYFKVLATVPGDEAYIKPAESGCPLAK